MIVSDNTIAAEGLGIFFGKSRNSFTETGEELATNVLKKPGWA